MQATAQLDVKRKELTSHLQKMGVGLGGLGKTLVTRTTDLFDQVCPQLLSARQQLSYSCMHGCQDEWLHLCNVVHQDDAAAAAANAGVPGIPCVQHLLQRYGRLPAVGH